MYALFGEPFTLPMLRSNRIMSDNVTTDFTFAVPDELLARCVGRLDLVKRVVGTFIEQLTIDVPNLASEIHDGNSEKAANLAHRIKGAAANVAAEALRSDAAELEKLSRAGELNTASARVASLEANWQNYREAATSFLD